MKEAVIEYGNELIKRIEDMLHPLFQSWGEKHNLTQDSIKTAQVAFLCLYDGLMIELLIGNWVFFVAGFEQMTFEKNKQ